MSRKDRSITALNGHLHDQLEALLNPDLNQKELENEIARTKAVSQIASQIIDSERVINERAMIVAEHAPQNLVTVLMPRSITHEPG